MLSYSIYAHDVESEFEIVEKTDFPQGAIEVLEMISQNNAKIKNILAAGCLGSSRLSIQKKQLQQLLQGFHLRNIIKAKLQA